MSGHGDESERRMLFMIDSFGARGGWGPVQTAAHERVHEGASP
jgi:hypothetical protein